MVFVAGLWDAPLQLRYRCQRIRAICREAPPIDSARGSADNCDWVWKLPNEKRQPIMQGLMFPDSAVRLRLDSAEKASGLRLGGEVDAATFRPILQYRFAAHHRLTMPVLVIAGRHDGAAASEGLRDLTRLLPSARYVEYEQGGHFAYLDEPERFARDVTAFLTSQ